MELQPLPQYSRGLLAADRAPPPSGAVERGGRRGDREDGLVEGRADGRQLGQPWPRGGRGGSLQLAFGVGLERHPSCPDHPPLLPGAGRGCAARRRRRSRQAGMKEGRKERASST